MVFLVYHGKMEEKRLFQIAAGVIAIFAAERLGMVAEFWEKVK